MLRSSFVIQRQASLRTDFKHSPQTVQESLVFEALSGFEVLDLGDLGVNFLRQLRLGHLVRIFAPAVADVSTDFGGCFDGSDDVI